MGYQELRLPELGIDQGPVTVSLWLVKRGARVEAGEPVVEVLGDSVVVDIPCPTEGTVIETLVDEGEPA